MFTGSKAGCDAKEARRALEDLRIVNTVNVVGLFLSNGAISASMCCDYWPHLRSLFHDKFALMSSL